PKTSDRKKFVILYQQTKNQLQKLVEHDKHKMMTATWKAVQSQLEVIEQKSRQPQVNYRRLNEELDLISKDLSVRFQELKARVAGKKAGPNKEDAQGNKKDKSKEKTKEKAKTQEQKQGPPLKADPNFIDFYQLLGIKSDASEADIKKAYRTKIKEYHPDHHDASTFKWVKEEAGRMTQKLGEGYEILRDPKQRATYDKMRKQQG
ncbi:MAG: DnaJ domain-containing protein, partial [SAR324 cluster bacterium]|nr:DnaJ domain-containing protein [SAR324 cluster bacterium]